MHPMHTHYHIHNCTHLHKLIFSLSWKVKRSKCSLEVLCKPSSIAVIFYRGSFSLFPLNVALKFGVWENIWILDQRCVVGIFYEDSLQSNYKAPAGEIISFCLTWNYAEALPVKTDTIRKCNHFSPMLPSVFRTLTEPWLQQAHLQNLIICTISKLQ